MKRNEVRLIGRLGKDPDIKKLESGKTVANFSLATSESYKTNTGEKKEVTDWHNIVVWGKQAEIIEKYVNKGDEIGVTGKLKTRSWEKDGITRYTTEIVVSGFDGSILMLGGKAISNNKQETSADIYNQGDGDDDLPF